MYTPCPCFVCENQISYMEADNNLTLLDGAVEVDILGSYGSIHDLSQMIIWICDECIKAKKEKIFMVNEDYSNDYEMENDDER